MIIDCHTHLSQREGHLEEIIAQMDKLGVDKVVLFGGGQKNRMALNQKVLEAAQAHPDRVIPFAYAPLGEAYPKDIDQIADAGFKGLKLINPLSNYNDRAYWPIYERAEAHGLVCLFHTGIIARRDENRYQDIDTARMEVIYLDSIVRKFQDMDVIMAHLGNPRYGDACMMLRWHPNLYSDLSGSTLKKKGPEFFKEMFWWKDSKTYNKDPLGRGPWEKIVYGSDVRPEDMGEVMEDYKRIMAACGVEEEIQKKVFGETAAKIFKISE